jgi:DNA-binding PadR family transcriptional regulator
LTSHDVSLLWKGEAAVRLERGGSRGLLLVALLDGPGHGYELIRRLESSSAGAWTPSPGSVYPALSLLADEGLVSCVADGDKRVYTLTSDGQTAAQLASQTPRPWDVPHHHASTSDGRPGLRDLTHSVRAAARQVGLEGSPAQIAQAIEVMRSTRQQLYRLLAEED